MSKKYTYEEVKKVFYNNGFALLSDEYLNGTSDLYYKDDNGFIYRNCFNNFLVRVRKGNFENLHYIDMNNRYVMDNINNFLKIHNSDWLVSKDFHFKENVRERIKLINIFTNETIMRQWKNIKKSVESGNDVTVRKYRTYESFKKEVDDVTNGEYELISDYVNVDTHVEILHKKCMKSWEITPNAFIDANHRCPYCNSGIVKTRQDIEDYLKTINNGEYELVGEYVNKTTPTIIRHKPCGHEWKTTIYHLRYYNFCPNCISAHTSKGEKRIKDFLLKNHVNFIHQYKIEECRNIRPLPFDFGVFDTYDNLKFLIEFQGEQHNRPACFGGTSYENALSNFQLTQKRDKIKEEYCKNNGIPLLKIEYSEIDKIESVLQKELLNMCA